MILKKAKNALYAVYTVDTVYMAATKILFVKCKEPGYMNKFHTLYRGRSRVRADPVHPVHRVHRLHGHGPEGVISSKPPHGLGGRLTHPGESRAKIE
jgi:hypothetical protein